MFKLARFAAVLLFAAGASAVCRAQDEEKVTVTSNLVSVNVSVTDSRGHYVRGLVAGQFEVYADGVRQQVAHFSDADAPFSVGIVYDMRGSTPARAGAVLETLRRFTLGFRREDDFFLLAFNERGGAELEFVPTAEQILDHLSFIPPRGPDSLYDAVYLAAEKMRSRPRAKRALIVISDGRDRNSRHGLRELRRSVREFDVQIYGVAVTGPNAGTPGGTYRWGFQDLTPLAGGRTRIEDADAALGRAALDEVARASGGSTYFPPAASEPELFDVCSRIALEVRRQYTVGFRPAGASATARFHKIRVRVRWQAAPLRLSYREGYLMPKG
jgi:Ca-activated chloride channel family protein